MVKHEESKPPVQSEVVRQTDRCWYISLKFTGSMREVDGRRFFVVVLEV